VGGAWAAIRGQRAAGWPPRRRRRKHPRPRRVPARALPRRRGVVHRMLMRSGGGRGPHCAPRPRHGRRSRAAASATASPEAAGGAGRRGRPHRVPPPPFSARAATRRPARTRGVGARTAGARGRRRPAAGRPTLREAMLGGRAAGKKGWEGKGCVRRAPATLHTPVRPLLRGLARTFRGPTPPPGCAPRPPGPPHPCGVRAASRPAAACPPAPAGALWTPTG